MNGGFKPRTEVLPAAQRRLWPELRPAAALGFVLYGGTAIALRLAHRTSVDFDFFSERPLDRVAIQAAFPFMSTSTVVQDQSHSLSLLVPHGNAGEDQVKVSFFGDIRFGRIATPNTTEDGVLQVAALDDLLATKVKVILQRVESKDYRDISALVSAGVSLPRALAAARQMFGPNFQPSESLKAMVYFEGGDLSTLGTAEKNILTQAAGSVRELPTVKIVSTRLVA